MDRERALDLRSSSYGWDEHIAVKAHEVADLCDAWLELHNGGWRPPYPCPINEANAKVHELKEDASKMMDELSRLRAENERRYHDIERLVGEGERQRGTIEYLRRRESDLLGTLHLLGRDPARLSKLEAVAEAARKSLKGCSGGYFLSVTTGADLWNALDALDRKEG